MKHFLFFLLLSNAAIAQYAPAAGQPGSTAIRYDSSAFVAWATGSEITRGYQDISDPSLGYASTGDSFSVAGIAGTNGMVSLGDGGNAVVRFAHPIINGPSWDFAVFENSFSDTFLELAFVEVSSDGIHFFRFPASSLTDTSVQTNSFGLTDPEKINNLAGKYRALYGTPFDLDELSGIAGLDVNDVRYVKIVDVTGSIDPQYASYDTAGRAVNDPWPTAYPSGGFDLDAVGVIHQNPVAGIDEMSVEEGIRLYPNPCGTNGSISLFMDGAGRIVSIRIYSLQGEQVLQQEGSNATVNVSGLSAGVYFVEVTTAAQRPVRKKLVIR